MGAIHLSSGGSIAELDIEIARGNVPGASPFGGFGERSDIGTGTPGEDVWRGAAVLIPTPATAGEAMSLVSTSVADVDVTGTGTRQVEVIYLDAAATSQVETVAMNGTTPVPMVATDVRFVQLIHAVPPQGTDLVTTGTISIFRTGSPAIVYACIVPGGNVSLNPARMVPTGKQLILTGWHCTESKARRLAFRLRSTDHGGVLLPNLFHFKDVMYLSESGFETTILVAIPALSVVKVTAFGDAVGGEASCSWEGLLFDA